MRLNKSCPEVVQACHSRGLGTRGRVGLCQPGKESVVLAIAVVLYLNGTYLLGFVVLVVVLLWKLPFRRDACVHRGIE
jgi:hypothetical protein